MIILHISFKEGNMKLKRTVSVLLAGLLIVGCGSGGEGESGDAGNSVVVTIESDLNTMDHHVATDGTSFIMQSMCIGGLAALDSEGQPIYDLAENWEVSEDGTVYTFYIRDGVNWSNGTPLTAHDFVYGWRRLNDPELASEYAFILETIGVKNAAAAHKGEVPLEDMGVEAVDDKTFVVTLDQPCGFLLSLMSFPSFFPLNQEFFEAHEATYAQSIDDLLYCGPYTFTKWEENTEYTFTKNPEYWDAANCTDDMDEVVFRFVSESQSAALAYQQGDIDAVKLSGDLVDQYKDDPGFTQRLEGFAWRVSINQQQESGIFDNLNFRKALTLSIDRDVIANDVLKDGSVAAVGFIPMQFAFGPDGTDYRDTAGDLLTFDVEAAQAALEEAKKELGVDNFSITLLYETDSEAPGKVAINLQSMWKENLGIEVTLLPKTKKERLQLMNNLDYDLGLTRWGPDYADPQTYLDLYKSDISGYNGAYFNDEFNALMNKAETGEDSTDLEKRWADMVEAEKMLLDDVAMIPVFQMGSAMLINPNITGIEFHSAGVDSYRHIKRVD
ncbi:MAG: peptide ABC transporter substrate-binding protein [Erysipelotrichaceae bacterium]|nr:peptide ABC transporter substrate-binding protein [Erysipelotrichaceae bacterium]